MIRRAAFLLIPLLAVLGMPALAQPAGKGWKPVPLKPTTFDAKLTFAGTFDGFERDAESHIATYGAYVALIYDGDNVSYTIGVDSGGSGTPIRQFPAVITITKGKGVLLTKHGSTIRWTSQYGARLVLDGKAFYLLDSNLNEQLGDEGKDGVVGPYSKTASPFDGTLWTETSGWDVKVEGQRAWVRPTKMPRQSKTDEVNQAWCVLNAWRQAAGSPPLKWSEETARHCRAHARYCQQNNVKTHEQKEGQPGYSEDGADAGRNSVLSFAYDKPRDAILEQLSCSYHLGAIIRPELATTGMAMVGKNFCCSTQDTSGSTPESPVRFVWPPHGALSVPRAFNETGEHPMPVPGKENDYKLKIGHVIMASVEVGCEPYSLVVKTARGQTVKGTLTTPDKPVDHPATRDNAGLVILAPDRPLPGNTVFIATLKLKAEDKVIERVWTFRTGSKAHRVVHRGRRR